MYRKMFQPANAKNEKFSRTKFQWIFTGKRLRMNGVGEAAGNIPQIIMPGIIQKA